MRIEYGESEYILGQCRPPDPFMLYIVFCWLALHTDRQMHMHSNAQMHMQFSWETAYLMACVQYAENFFAFRQSESKCSGSLNIFCQNE